MQAPEVGYVPPRGLHDGWQCHLAAAGQPDMQGTP
jgi:hypothetical protein